MSIKKHIPKPDFRAIRNYFLLYEHLYFEKYVSCSNFNSCKKLETLNYSPMPYKLLPNYIYSLFTVKIRCYERKHSDCAF